MSLRQKIEQWDAKSASDIEAIYQAFTSQSTFIAQVVELVAIPSTQIGATWLLKRFLENGNSLAKQLCVQFVAQLSTLNHWQSQLHALQIIGLTTIESRQVKKIEIFVRSCLCSDNKFVRAWSYDALFRLSLVEPVLRDEVAQFFEMALRDEAASVKARVRQLLKQGW